MAVTAVTRHVTAVMAVTAVECAGVKHGQVAIAKTDSQERAIWTKRDAVDGRAARVQADLLFQSAGGPIKDQDPALRISTNHDRSCEAAEKVERGDELNLI